MEELLNLFVELYQGIAFSKFVNKKKPYAKYAADARKLSREEGRVLIESLREKDWAQCENGAIPTFILFKGRNHFSPYMLDREFRFIKRLYNIQKPEGFMLEHSLLVKIDE